MMNKISFSKTQNTLIVIVGPTAIGKTHLSIEIAKKYQTEIISADSRQFFKELKIGTAPPSPLELETVKHNFISNISISDYYNVSKFEMEALEKISDIFSKNNYAILVGGSGLYINAVCYGIDELPELDEKIRNDIKHKFSAEGIEALQKQLKNLDPEYYKIIDLTNPKRLMRALEICIATGKTYSSLRKNEPKPRNFKIIKIGLNRNREELYEIINNRVDEMIKNGLLDEAKKFYKYKNLNALNTVGYKEIFNFLDNKITLEQAIENIKTNTRRFAKRQLTWFNKDKSIKWFHPDEKKNILNYIESFQN